MQAPRIAPPNTPRLVERPRSFSARTGSTSMSDALIPTVLIRMTADSASADDGKIPKTSAIILDPPLSHALLQQRQVRVHRYFNELRRHLLGRIHNVSMEGAPSPAA